MTTTQQKISMDADEVKRLAAPYSQRWIAQVFTPLQGEFNHQRAFEVTHKAVVVTEKKVVRPHVHVEILSKPEDIKKDKQWVGRWHMDDPVRGHKAGYEGIFTESPDDVLLNVVTGTMSQSFFALRTHAPSVQLSDCVIPCRYMAQYMVMHDFVRDIFQLDFSKQKIDDDPFYERYKVFQDMQQHLGAMLCARDIVFGVAPAIGHAHSPARTGSAPVFLAVWDEYVATRWKLTNEGGGVYTGWEGEK